MASLLSQAVPPGPKLGETRSFDDISLSERPSAVLNERDTGDARCPSHSTNAEASPDRGEFFRLATSLNIARPSAHRVLASAGMIEISAKRGHPWVRTDRPEQEAATFGARLSIDRYSITQNAKSERSDLAEHYKISLHIRNMQPIAL